LTCDFTKQIPSVNDDITSDAVGLITNCCRPKEQHTKLIDQISQLISCDSLIAWIGLELR